MSMITFHCYVCNKALKVEAEKAGRKAKCIGCGTIITIPAQSAAKASKGPPPPPPGNSGARPKASGNSERVVSPIFAEYIADDELEE